MHTGRRSRGRRRQSITFPTTVDEFVAPRRLSGSKVRLKLLPEESMDGRERRRGAGQRRHRRRARRRRTRRGQRRRQGLHEKAEEDEIRKGCDI